MGSLQLGNWSFFFFVVMLIVVLRVRMRVNPIARIYIDSPPDEVFDQLDVHDGKIIDYGRTSVAYRLLDEFARTFEFTYRTTMVGGAARTASAKFKLADRVPGKLIRLERHGLEGKPVNSELLEIRYDLAAEGGGTRLTSRHAWGPRPILAQVLARTDLWGGAYRIKGMVEHGIPNDKPYYLISGAVAVVTGLLTLLTFSWFIDFAIAAIVIFSLIVHEFGHLIAYRMIGQPWGRIMFLPFLGAVALPRLAFETQAQLVFAALMGPGFSIVLALLCMLPTVLGSQPNDLLVWVGLATVALNMFNLLPVAPLDGGIAMRSVFSRMLGDFMRIGLMLLGVVIIAVGLKMKLFWIVALGIIAIVINVRGKVIDRGLLPLNGTQICLSLIAYLALGAAYIGLLSYFAGQYHILNQNS